MKPYHPNNLNLQPFAHWKVISLAWAAKALGVQFHIHGIPFGAMALGVSNERMQGTMSNDEAGSNNAATVVRHPESGTVGIPDAVADHPDGPLLRINDHWFKASELIPA
jgi:hypothetical protein